VAEIPEPEPESGPLPSFYPDGEHDGAGRAVHLVVVSRRAALTARRRSPLFLPPQEPSMRAMLLASFVPLVDSAANALLLCPAYQF
jgi:hypothetical protein